MELAAKAVARFALVSGTYEFGIYEMERAFEWLAAERHEGKRLAAVCGLILLQSLFPHYEIIVENFAIFLGAGLAGVEWCNAHVLLPTNQSVF